MNTGILGMKKILPLLLLAIIPFILLALLHVVMAGYGLYYIFPKADPSYSYYFNSWNLANFQTVHFIDHPGTPLIILGAFLLHMINFVSGGLPRDILVTWITHAEFYISVICWVLGMVNVVAAFWVGSRIFQNTQRLGLALLIQCSPFIYFSTFRYLLFMDFRPELIVSTVGWIFLYILISCMYDQRRSQAYYAVSFGILVGFALALKVSFFAFFFIPLFLLSHRHKIQYVVVLAISFFIFTLPVVYLYPKVFQRGLGLITHRGLYGSGQWGLVDIQALTGNLSKLFRSNIVFAMIYIFSLIVLSLSWVKKETKGVVELKGLVAIVFSQSLVIFFMVKNESFKDYYLSPTSMLSVFSFYLSFHCLLKVMYPFRLKTAYGAMLCLIAGIFILNLQVNRVFREARSRNSSDEKIILFNERLERDYAGWVKIYDKDFYSFRAAVMNYGKFIKNDPSLLMFLGEHYYYCDTKNVRCYDWFKRVSMSDIIKSPFSQGVLFITRSKLLSTNASLFNGALEEVFHNEKGFVYVIKRNVREAGLPSRDISHSVRSIGGPENGF